LGLLKKSGAWFYYGETRIAQGRENARLYLKENKELCGELEKKILAEYHLENRITASPNQD
jgi:recombination protein RecA